MMTEYYGNCWNCKGAGWVIDPVDGKDACGECGGKGKEKYVVIDENEKLKHTEERDG